MEPPIDERPGGGKHAAERSEDLTADLLRLTAAIVTLVIAIALGVLR